MWPDMSQYPAAERYPAPGFTYPDGKPAELFSSDNPATVLRHFEWMCEAGLDGAWLQHFLVGLPGGPEQNHYPSRLHVLNHVRAAALKTGRVWALSYDLSGMAADRIFEVLTTDWKKMVDDKIIADPRYLHHDGRPVVQIWGYYFHNQHNQMTAELGNRLADFFRAPGPYAAFLVGGGDWDWRRNPDADWQALCRRFEAYCPWNVGNYSADTSGTTAKTSTTNHAGSNHIKFISRTCCRLPSTQSGS